MKFLTFADTHGEKQSIKQLVSRTKKKDIDFVVCAGDFTNFGQGLRHFLKQFNDTGKKMYIIPGNHEEYGESKAVLADYPNCINLHLQAIEIGDYVFLGQGGDGFSMQDAEFRKIARKWYSKYNGRKIILVTHGPPFGTKLDMLMERHVGNKDYLKFIRRIKPKVVIAGHLHETAGAMDKIGDTRLVNPGWDGMVIELK